MSATQMDDEIDLIELFEVLWHGKWIIGGFTGLAGLLAAIFLVIMPPSYAVTLAIRDLSPQEMAAYAPLNNVPGISPPIYSDGILIGQTGVISSENLTQAVRSDIESKTSLSAAIADLDPNFMNFDGSAAEKAQALATAANDFKLEIRPDAADLLTTNTKNVALTRATLGQFTERVNRIIRKQNLIAIANLSQSIETSLAYEIESLEDEIENKKQQYLDELQRDIVQLREQARIARVLNLATPSQNMTINATASSGGNENSQRNNEARFLRGFKALEEEVRLLEQRKNNDWRVFAPGYFEEAAQLRQLKNDKRVRRVETGLALAPISDAESFKPVNFDLQNLLVEPTISKRLIFVLVTVLSALIASIFLLLRHFTMTRRVALD